MLHACFRCSTLDETGREGQREWNGKGKLKGQKGNISSFSGPFFPRRKWKGKRRKIWQRGSSSFSSLPFYEFRGIPTNGGRSKEKRGKRKKLFFFPDPRCSALVLASFLLPSLPPPGFSLVPLALVSCFLCVFSATVVAKRDNVNEISRKN